MITFLRNALPQDSFIRRWYSLVNAFFAALFFGFPSRNLIVIGVTGTDGKTTTTEMIAHLLRKNGEKILSLSTTEVRMDNEILMTDKRTTPSPWNLQKWIWQAKKKGIKTVVLEVSSHALSQNRIFGISFHVAVLTNITPEHLDYHGDLEQYALAKKRLFTKFLKKRGDVIFNVDDDFGKKWAAEFPYAKTYSLKKFTVDFWAKNPRPAEKGIVFEVGGRLIFMPLFGTFNAANAAAAVLAVESLGFSRNKLLIDLAFFEGVSGRMEKIDTDQKFSVFLDFAMSPGAMTKVLESARKMGGKIIFIFGSPGTHPDPTVRAEMGFISALGADFTIVTDDEPYFSDPTEIRQQILSGAKKALSEEEFTQKVLERGDRRVAIETAFQRASEGDSVIISGMGHLTTRNIGGVETPWSDKKIVQEILATFPK